jgi:hypothetical protein
VSHTACKRLRVENHINRETSIWRVTPDRFRRVARFQSQLRQPDFTIESMISVFRRSSLIFGFNRGRNVYTIILCQLNNRLTASTGVMTASVHSMSCK